MKTSRPAAKPTPASRFAETSITSSALKLLGLTTKSLAYCKILMRTGNNQSRQSRDERLKNQSDRNNKSGSTLSSNQLQSSGSINSNNRYEACALLAKKDITNVIWLEDLLALCGSETMVWDLNLLVQDPCEAAHCLSEDGYKQIAPDIKFKDEPEFSQRGVRMTRSSPSGTAVVLLPAQDWHYDLSMSVQNFVPPLHKFLDSVIEFWLSISSRDYVDRLAFALYIASMINYCYDLADVNGEHVNTPDYAKNIKPEHRELHYDIVAANPHGESFTHTRRHQYHTRRSREIKKGTFTPEPYQKGVFRLSLTAISEL